MTQPSAVVNPVWVLDAMCLIHFGRADRLDVQAWTAEFGSSGVQVDAVSPRQSDQASNGSMRTRGSADRPH